MKDTSQGGVQKFYHLWPKKSRKNAPCMVRTMRRRAGDFSKYPPSCAFSRGRVDLLMLFYHKSCKKKSGRPDCEQFGFLQKHLPIRRFYSILTRHHREIFSCQSTPVLLIRNGTSKCTALEGIPCRQAELRCYALIYCNHVYETSFSRNHLNPVLYQ